MLESVGSYAFSDCSNMKIYCYSNSYPHTYAVSESIPYVLLDGHTCIDEDNDQMCDLCGSPIATARFSQVSLTLDGDIGINSYLTLNQTLISDSEAYFLVTLPDGESETILVSECPMGGPVGVSTQFYKLTGKVAAKEMTDKVKLEVYSGSELITSFEYSVVQYASLVLNDPNANAELLAMIKAMLNYGATSQVKFGYHLDSLANVALDEGEKTPAAADATALAGATTEGSVDGFEYRMFSTILETKTTLHQYFTLSKGSLGDYSFTVDGANVTPTQTTVDGVSMYYVDVADIAAKDMGEVHTLVITKGTETRTIRCSVHSYMKTVILANDDVELIEAIHAMYAYNQAAAAYFAAN